MSNNLTWRQLKMLANDVPEELLDRDVVSWADDEEEGGVVITGFEILDENYLFDGDEGCAPESGLIKSVSEEEFKEGDHYVVHPKGTRILNHK